MDIKNMKNYLYWLFCQFELITCSYLMEPWEKVLFYTFNITMLFMVLYTAYIYVPIHISTAFQFSRILCSKHETTYLVVIWTF
uniref:Serine palmitoyltransferase small subunit B n=1 Tax=Melopsittacus undulatus TaxID=13146 RepID=A0A8C6NGE5_MELUD